MTETRTQRLERQAQFGMTQREVAEFDRLAEQDRQANIAHNNAREALIRQAYAGLAARELDD